MTNYLTRKGGKNIKDQLPLQVDDVTQASDRVAAPTETVTFACGAKASSTGINALDKAPILNLTGDKVGSYWGSADNLVYVQGSSTFIGALVETATAAEVVITDLDNNLELFFEIASGNRTHVLRAIDADGSVLYGWIGGVAATGDAYTIDVHNAVTGGAQSWVGTLASFDGTAVRIEIYRYESSFAWVTGTVLTEEVALDEENVIDRQKEFFDSLSAGQYALNYRTGAIYFKKATTGTSDTCTYNTMASASVTIGGGGGSTTLVDDAAFGIATSLVTPVGYLADETATDSVGEGDIGVARMTLDRRTINAGQILDDAALGVGTSYVNVIGGFADESSTDSVGEGDVGALRMTLDRRLIIAGQTLDDAAFGIGTEYVNATGFLADEATTDSVDEGDIGIARMTLDRRQIMAGQTLDDAAFGVGTEYVNAIGALADEAATDSVDEGDIGVPRMTLDRKLYSASEQSHDAAATAYTTQIGGRYKVEDAAAWPTPSGAEDDITAAAVSAYGVQYFKMVAKDGSSSPHDESENGIRTYTINLPEDAPVDYDLVDTTNVSAATHYYPAATGQINDGYKDLSISGKFIDADGTLTLTIEAMNDEDTTSGDWIQVYAYDDKNKATSNSWTVTNGTLTFALSLNNFNYKYWRAVVVASGATNTVIVKGRSKKV